MRIRWRGEVPGVYFNHNSAHSVDESFAGVVRSTRELMDIYRAVAQIKLRGQSARADSLQLKLMWLFLGPSTLTGRSRVWTTARYVMTPWSL
jgi:hypothetical protein